MTNDCDCGGDDLGHMLWRLVSLTEPVRLRWWAQLGLTMPQVRLLVAVGCQPGVTAGALAERFAVSAPTITGLVDKLAAAGLVCRRECSGDRRLVGHHLTPAGENALHSVHRDGHEFVATIVDRMSETDRRALSRGVEAFLHAGTPGPVAAGAARGRHDD